MKNFRWSNISFILAGLLLNNWILGVIINWHLFKAGGSVSEFSAATQPHNWLFRILDAAAGAMIFAASVILFKSVTRYSSVRSIAVGGMVLGVANCLDALLPLPCSGVVNPHCSAPVHINLHRLSLPDHAVSSVVIAICFLMLPIAGAVVAKKARKFKILSIAAAILMVLFLINLSLESFTESGLADHLLGYVQEVQMLVFGVWFAWLPAQFLSGADYKINKTDRQVNWPG